MGGWYVVGGLICDNPTAVLVSSLLQANANVVDSDDATPLHVAAFNGNARVTKTLLNHNVRC